MGILESFLLSLSVELISSGVKYITENEYIKYAEKQKIDLSEKDIKRSYEIFCRIFEDIKNKKEKSVTEEEIRELIYKHNKKMKGRTIGLIILIIGIVIAGILSVLSFLPKNSPIPWSGPTTDATLAQNPAYETKFEVVAEYKYRDKKETQSTSKELEGWTLIPEKTTVEWSAWGQWSDWSTNKIENSEECEVETSTQYRFRNLLTKDSHEKELLGWTYNNAVEEWGDFGGWSTWTTEYIQETDNCDVEKCTQYRYRDKMLTTNSIDTMQGWTLIPEKTNVSYTDWSEWKPVFVAGREDREVETEEVKQYRYRRTCWYSSKGTFSSSSLAPRGYILASSRDQVKPGTNYYYIDYSRWISENERPNGEECIDANGNKYLAYRVDDIVYYLPEEEKVIESQYRYRDKICTYYFWKWDVWSDWSNNIVTASEEREIETRTLYRCRTRDKVYIYNFSKWSDWSDWNSEKLNIEGDSNEVESRTVYRFRTRSKNSTYYFERWTDWSLPQKEKPSEKEGREIKEEKVTYYWYRLKPEM